MRRGEFDRTFGLAGNMYFIDMTEMFFGEKKIERRFYAITIFGRIRSTIFESVV